jgi:hypothetical protein
MNNQKKPVKDQFSSIVKASDSDEEFSATSLLAQQLEKERAQQKEERLLWVIILIVFLDLLCLKECQNWSLPLIVGVFEAAIVFVLAHKWSVKPIELLFTMVYQSFQRRK